MRDKKMVALARVVLSSREHVIMLQPAGKGMLGTTIRYPHGLRKSSDYFSDIPDVKIDPELLRLAEHILQGKATPFNPSRFVDRYEQAVIEMIETKRQGLPANAVRSVPVMRGPRDLMEALKRSLGAPKTAPANDTTAAKPTKAKKAKPRVEGQRELLLPITGGAAAKDQAGGGCEARAKGRLTMSAVPVCTFYALDEKQPTLTLHRVGFFRAWAAMREELADFYGEDEHRFDTNEAHWNGENEYVEVVTIDGKIISSPGACDWASDDRR